MATTKNETLHLTADQLAAYTDGRISNSDRGPVEEHLSLCRECRDQLAMACRIARRQKAPTRWLYGFAVAAAAVLAVLVVGTLVTDGGREGSGPVLRSNQERRQVITTLSPAEGAAVRRESLTFLWRSPSPDASYQVTITDRNGDVVWTSPSVDTTLVPPRDIGLEPGQVYYWFVDALLVDGSATTTGVKQFVIEP